MNPILDIVAIANFLTTDQWDLSAIARNVDYLVRPACVGCNNGRR
jgi:hypothetical protein